MFICTSCNKESKFNGVICPNCFKQGTLVKKERETNAKNTAKSAINNSNQRMGGKVLIKKTKKELQNMKLSEEYYSINNKEINRALPGGFLKGGIYLLGGEPGIGKSTLVAQIIGQLEKENNIKCGYFSGEENEMQIIKRFNRLKIDLCDIYNSGCIEDIFETTKHEGYKFIVIDSIQTANTSYSDGLAGGVSQMKAIGAILENTFKRAGVTVLVIGHVNKDGDVAGPKYLEHMVDCVSYIEGEKGGAFRFLRSQKNRGGSIEDVGIFEMTGDGLIGVTDYQKRTIAGFSGKPGNVLGMGIDNGRPIVVNVEVLLKGCEFSFPQRNCIGYDKERLNLIISIIEKHLKVDLSKYDIFLNIPGELSFKKDNGLDIAICAAILSSLYNTVYKKVMLFGEVTLMGIVRETTFYKKRLNESKGFTIIDDKEVKDISQLMRKLNSVGTKMGSMVLENKKPVKKEKQIDEYDNKSEYENVDYEISDVEKIL